MPLDRWEAKRKLVRQSLVAKTLVDEAQKLCFARGERLDLVNCWFGNVRVALLVKLPGNFVKPVEKFNFTWPNQPEIASASVSNNLADRPLVQDKWINQ